MSNQELEQWSQLTVVLQSGAQLVISLEKDAAEGFAQQLMNPSNGVVLIRGRRARPLIVPAELRICTSHVAAVDIEHCDMLVFGRAPVLQFNDWRTQAEVVRKSDDEYWVRVTDRSGLYWWLHPTENKWVGEPHQITMGMFPTRAAAKGALKLAQAPQGIEL